MNVEHLVDALRRARRHRDGLPPGSEEWRAAQRAVEELRQRLDEARQAFAGA
ncbi:MAG TPA: hypothetical protein VEY67_12010 [Candidatus Dormibacteraeota bacterium]|nr:hypothetical protein [Candidatus Dormibacteraeota bacterium]